MSTAIDALQVALAAEHAAIYGYGTAGAYLSGASQAIARQYLTAHEVARDTLITMIAARGATPVVSQAYYTLPFPVTSAARATALATHLEEGTAAAYLGVVAVQDAGLRLFAAAAVRTAAARAARWRGATVPFPGLP